MEEQTSNVSTETQKRPYEPPRFEVIPLDCEITAYAPLDDDQPPF